jgi:hypothetical protein
MFSISSSIARMGNCNGCLNSGESVPVLRRANSGERTFSPGSARIIACVMSVSRL